jgi:7-cyano-7-deazaguanine synthase
MHKKALVLFSGGQDSTTCLAWALSRFESVETVGFDYGQRHRVELDARIAVLDSIRATFKHWAPRLAADHVIALKFLSEISETSLTRESEIVMQANGLPSTFVPGRNIVFMTAAAAVAYRRGIKVLVGGMCETDFPGYPDCRDDTLKALQVALGLGMDYRFVIETPLMWIDKAQTWALAGRLGDERLVELIIEKTHTCYLGNRESRHVWGYGCGTCPACELRAKGFAKYRAGAAGGWRA